MSDADWMWCYENPKKASAEIARLTARIEQLEKALAKIANCGQSQEPDHWKFRVMARDTARTTLEASDGEQN